MFRQTDPLMYNRSENCRQHIDRVLASKRRIHITPVCVRSTSKQACRRQRSLSRQ